jgi:hypothetical protein
VRKNQLRLWPHVGGTKGLMTMCTKKPMLFTIVMIASIISSQGCYVAAQTLQPTEAEKALAAQIKCEDFTRNADGSWLSGPNAKAGSMSFSNSVIGRGVVLNGADLFVVLNQKCRNRL